MRQIELLKFTVGVLDRLGIPYAIVGSYASGTWGEPRMTRDIDIVIDLRQSQVEALCDEFPDPDFYVSKMAVNEAVEAATQFNIIHPSSGNKIDFIVAGTAAFSSMQLSRRQIMTFESGVSAYIAAPEDVILGKLLYYREGGSEKHLRDIKGILKVSGNVLNRDYLDHQAAQLGVSDFWQTLLTDPK